MAKSRSFQVKLIDRLNRLQADRDGLLQQLGGIADLLRDGLTVTIEPRTVRANAIEEAVKNAETA